MTIYLNEPKNGEKIKTYGVENGMLKFYFGMCFVRQ